MKTLTLYFHVTREGKQNQRTETALELVGSEGPRFLSRALPSSILIKRIPSLFAKILIPLSPVVTANNDPSLLNLSLGLACE